MSDTDVTTSLRAMYMMGRHWKDRHRVIIPFLKDYLGCDANRGRTFNNRAITTVLMDNFRIPAEFRKAVSNDVSGVARQKEMELFVRPGPEIKLFGKIRRTRVFSSPGAPAATELTVEAIVNPVDKLEISRHPKPGYTRQTCPTCQAGHIYVKPKEQV